MSQIRANNNPRMLEWARNEVGYSIELASAAIGIAPEKLVAAESGEHQLTLNQLKKIADKYGCPFGFFYLSNLPYENTYQPVPDFRVEPGYVGVEHHRLNFELKSVRDRRIEYLDLVNTLETVVPDFSALKEKEPVNAGALIRRRLNVTDVELSKLNFDEVYSFWKSKIEADGVLVYESQYIPDETGVLGAAIYFEKCPVILVKRGPRYNERKLFTLLHEYAHLLMGKSAINDSGSQSTSGTNTDIERVESKCNRLAAEILVPTANFPRQDYRHLEPHDQMVRLANTFKVTFSTAAVCLRRLELISQRDLDQLLEIRRRESEKKKSLISKEVKIPRENVMRLDMGRPMFNLVLEAYNNGVIDVFDASKILHLRVKKIDKLLSGVR